MKPYFKLFFVALSFTGLVSCKKDKLSDEKLQLEGKWRLRYGVLVYAKSGYFPPLYPPMDTVYADKNYYIEFLNNGKVVFYENAEEINTDRIVFQKWENSTLLSEKIHPDVRSFEIKLNNRIKNVLTGEVWADTLTLNGADFPEQFKEEPDVHYLSVFDRM